MTKVRLEFTWNSILKAEACESGKEMFLSKFRRFNPIKEPDRPINILELLEINGVNDTLWVLRATLQDARAISLEIAERASSRADSYAYKAAFCASNAAFNASYVFNAASDDASSAASRVASDAAFCAIEAASNAGSVMCEAEQDKVKEDLIDLLEANSE